RLDRIKHWLWLRDYSERQRLAAFGWTDGGWHTPLTSVLRKDRALVTILGRAIEGGDVSNLVSTYESVLRAKKTLTRSEIEKRLLLLGQLVELGTAARSFDGPLPLYRGVSLQFKGVDWMSQWRKPGSPHRISVGMDVPLHNLLSTSSSRAYAKT